MPVLKYLADTNTVSDYFRSGNPVKEWFGRIVAKLAFQR